MSNQKLLAALEAAFTGYEKNSSALLLELLADDFRFEFSDSLPYGGSYVGRDEFLGFWKGSPRSGPTSATTRTRSSTPATPSSCRSKPMPSQFAESECRTSTSSCSR
jgi:hypothetical protein